MIPVVSFHSRSSHRLLVYSRGISLILSGRRYQQYCCYPEIEFSIAVYSQRVFAIAIPVTNYRNIPGLAIRRRLSLIFPQCCCSLNGTPPSEHTGGIFSIAIPVTNSRNIPGLTVGKDYFTIFRVLLFLRWNAPFRTRRRYLCHRHSSHQLQEYPRTEAIGEGYI